MRKRQVINCVGPMMLITVLATLVFIMPLQADDVGGGERIGYSVTLLLTIFVLSSPFLKEGFALLYSAVFAHVPLNIMLRAAVLPSLLYLFLLMELAPAYLHN